MKKNKNRLWRFIYKLHRYIGLCTALVLIMLAITGIALNHTEDLKLDSQMIESSLILDWYGIQAPQRTLTFATRRHWLTQINQQIYLDSKILLKSSAKLQGVVETDKFIVLALDNALIMLSLDGEIIEQTAFERIEKIAGDLQKIIVKTNKNLIYSDDQLLSWHPASLHAALNWSKPAIPPHLIIQQIKANYRSTILPLERVILDLHSGRLFGYIGVIIVDISGIFLIILAFSGCGIWIKHKLRHFKRT